MAAPRIAVTACSALHDYEESVRRAGGEPWVLDFTTHGPGDVVGSAAGILLTGGGDVLPAIYGEPAHGTYEAAETGRDDYELELVRRALDADVPVLAICRGLQVLNVALGGTLVQDIPSQVPSALVHEVETPRAAIVHPVWIVRDTVLARLLGSTEGNDERGVNSRHHQSIGRVGRGLVVSASAPDGVVEAAEDPTRRFCVGVQWHPENFYRTGEFRGLFDGLIEACR
jgi:putative glutamine amidotransferase